ncbi:hypothetical protein CRG98_001060 [Punica granatum]|uniref:Uncharacterized protein n=1 Tax=Punica granatum TaxID=22663 RepID=A0A2I0LD08_PUNGR|nr:hypothetical protein CRG98_001060 [Punica granatum]
MHVRKYDETRESNLDRVKKVVPCPKGAREHSVTSLGGKPSCRVDPYSPAKITQNRARLEFRTRLAQVGSDIATEAPDGIFELGQRLSTANSPPEVTVVVVFRKESSIDPICKKTVQTVRNFDPTGQSGCFFFLGLNRQVVLGFLDSLTP